MIVNASVRRVAVTCAAMAANGKDFGQLVPFGDPVRHLPQLCRRFQHAAAHISRQPALAWSWRGVAWRHREPFVG